MIPTTAVGLPAHISNEINPVFSRDPSPTGFTDGGFLDVYGIG